MTADDLRMLAGKVEKAEAGDRELDAEIVWRTTPGIVGIERGPLDDGTDYLFEWWPRRTWTASWLYVPAFTASLDTAVSLVPAGRVVRLLIDPDGRSIGYVNHPGHIGGGREAATPALALTAAALRALAEEASE